MATATRPLSDSTTWPLYQGAGTAGTTRPEESVASGATNHHLDRKVAGSIHERTIGRRVFNLAIMVVCNVPTLQPVKPRTL